MGEATRWCGMKVSISAQHCTSSPLPAVPVIPFPPSQSPRSASSPRPALSAARLRRSRTRPRRMRSCPSGCILGRQGSRPEGSRRQGQGLVRHFHLGTCGLRHLRRVPRAGEGPALCVRRSRGQPDPRVPCLPAPRCPSRWDPIPHRTNHPPPRGQLFLFPISYHIGPFRHSPFNRPLSNGHSPFNRLISNSCLRHLVNLES